MTRIFIFGTTLIFSSTFLFGQDKNSLSLDNAIQQALKNRLDLKIQQINVQVSDMQVKEVNSRNLPQISSDLDVRYNSELQTNILPGIFFGQPNGDGKPVQFGTTYNTLWAFNFNQILYNPVNSGDRQIAQAQTRYNQFNVRKTEIDVKMDVTQAYFTALLWKEKTDLTKINVDRTNNIYTTGKDQLSQAQITSYDLQHYRIDYENAFSENEKNKKSLELSLTDLSYKMGDDTIKKYILSDDINHLYLQYMQATVANPELKRPELDMEKWQLAIYQLNIKKQNLSYIPSISFYGNYTFQYLDNDFSPFTSSYWYPFNYLGVKASIPIFDGLLKERSKSEYKLKSESSRLNYEKLKNDYQQETRNSLTSLLNAQTDLDYQKKNLDLANDLYKIDSDRLKNGTIKPNDLATTYYTLQQTQTNYLNAVYNYLVGIVQYKKTVGLL